MNAPSGDEDLLRAAASIPHAHKAVRLQRMRRIATGLLAGMVAVLFMCVIWQPAHPALVWVRAFAEAGTVGAIADWYAVVALFRRPLGLPLPHTAIIPRNQQRIAQSLGDFVETHFLAPELVVGRLRGHNAAWALAAWLAVPANSRAAGSIVADSLPRLLDGLDDADVERFFERVAVPRLRRFDVARVLGALLAALTEGGHHQPLLDRGLAGLEQWLAANRELVKARFSAASKYTPAPLDAYIVKKFVEGIVALLHEVSANPDHELRHQFDAVVQDLIVQLRVSPSHGRLGRALMRDCIRHFRREGYLRRALARLRDCVSADIDNQESVLRSVAADMLMALGKSVRDDPALQRKLNAWWLELAHALVLRYRSALSALITDVVKGWGAEEVGEKIEAEIGRDLQFVRINGALVGGAAGVLLHAATLALAA